MKGVINLLQCIARRSTSSARHYHGQGHHGASSTTSTSSKVKATTTVDLRSDTFTSPTTRMRQAMRDADVGDDVYGEDPTVNKLQEVCAQLMGKEAALLLPTCTMANTASVLVHCPGRFSEILVGDESHMHLYEVAGMAQLAGVQGRTVQTHKDGTLDLTQLRDKIRPVDDDHQPWTKLICLENTQNKCGGKVLSLDYMAQVKSLAEAHGLHTHLDGARVFNASTRLSVEPAQIAQHFDSVSFCFSKGLCCPMGSILVGDKEFIDMARRARKAMGGGLRQAGVIAAPMLVALEETLPGLRDDHSRAASIAEGITSLGQNPVCSVELSGVHSNIVMIDMLGPCSREAFCQRLMEVTSQEANSLGHTTSVLMLPFSSTTVRYVTYRDITDDQVDKAVRKIQYVIQELSDK